MDDLNVRLVLGRPSHDDTLGAADGVRLECNAQEAIPFEAGSLSGKVMFIQRPDPEPSDWRYAKHFKNKLRRFEFRLQCKFKEDPGQDVFFGVELPKLVPLSWPLKMTVKWILTVVHMLCTERGVSYHYSLDAQQMPDGGTIWPHLSFPMLAADAIVRTPQGQVPPLLTGSFEKTPYDEKRKVVLNTEDTFTFAYWSKNADFVRWELCNLPLGWSSSFCNFIDDVPVHLTSYHTEQSIASGGYLTDKNKRYLMSLVLSNKRATCHNKRAQGESEATENTSLQVSKGEVGKTAHFLGPTPFKWSHECAEMSPDELEAMWFNPPIRVNNRHPTPQSSRTTSSRIGHGLLSSFSQCCTSNRQTIR